MMYIQVESHIYKAETPKLVVRKMWQTSFDDAINKDNFMFNVKERVQEIKEKYIPNLSASVANKDYMQFLTALEEQGIVKIFKCPECEHYINNKCEKGLKTSAFKSDCEAMEIKGYESMGV